MHKAATDIHDENRRRNILFPEAIKELDVSGGAYDSYRFVSMSVLTSTMMIVEMTAGMMTGSLTLLSDSLHMLTDLIALFIGFMAHRKANSSKKTKYDHFMVDIKYETVGALVNGTVLLTICFLMAIEAVQRIGFEHEQVENVNLVLIVGGLGLFINTIGLLIFGHHGHHGHSHGHSHGNTHTHHEHSKSDVEMKFYQQQSHSNITSKKKETNLNIHGVFLHILSDLCSSIAVITSALIIKYVEGWWIIYVDPGCTLIIVMFISRAAYPLMKQSLTILLSKSPLHFDVINQMEKQLKNIPGILNVHELQCFEVKPGFYMATVHLIIDCEFIDDASSDIKMSIIDQSKATLHRNGIHSSIVQSEFVPRGNKEWINLVNPCTDYVCNETECIRQGIVLSNSLANARRENRNKINKNIEQHQTSHLLGDLSLYNNV